MLDHHPDISVPPERVPLESDEIFTALKTSINSLAKSVKKAFYISTPELHFHYPVPHELAKRLWMNESLDSLNMGLMVSLMKVLGLCLNCETLWEHLERARPDYIRLHGVECDKCVLVDWTKAFCDEEGTCHAYDPSSQLAYFYDAHHYSYLGCQQIRPVLRGLLN